MPNRPKKFPSRQLDQFNIRLPSGLRDRLSDLAARNNRSMNAEIIGILEIAVDRAQPHKQDTQSAAASLSGSLDLIIDEAIGMQSTLKEVLLKTSKS